VKDGSPVLKTGFENFPMDRFGVKKPALKAIARTPVIPELKAARDQASNSSPAAPLFWLGAALHGLQGEEFSAFGTAKEDGGVQLVTVPEGSAAAKAGFQKNDLVQSINGRKVTGTADLFKALATLGDAPLTVKVIRNQSPLDLKPANAPFTLVESADNAAGFTKADDNLPKRLMTEAAKTGPGKGMVSKLDEMLPKYYEARGWDGEGHPTSATRERLGL
jgi:membrane-associated protease RseP (regulator of RpoE activity)